MNFVLLGLMWYIAFIISISIHEASHAFAAMKFGDDTAYQNGQVTLHPLPHIMRHPFGTIIVPIISYVLGGFMIGWASAPYNPSWAARNPKKAALMGLAGPASNLLLVIISGILIHVGILMNLFEKPAEIGLTNLVAPVSPGLATGLAVLISLLFSLNCLLFVFNLIPVPPLDGTALLELTLKGEKLAKFRQLSTNPTFCFIGLFLAWNLFEYIFAPVYSLALSLLYPGSG